MLRDMSYSIEERAKDGKADSDRSSLRWMGFGVEFVGVMGLFTYAGYWADGKFGTGPWLMIAGMAVAFVGMMYLMIKEAAKWHK